MSSKAFRRICISLFAFAFPLMAINCVRETANITWPPSGVIDLARKEARNPDRPSGMSVHSGPYYPPKEIIGIFREPRILLAHHPYSKGRCDEREECQLVFAPICCGRCQHSGWGRTCRASGHIVGCSHTTTIRQTISSQPVNRALKQDRLLMHPAIFTRPSEIKVRSTEPGAGASNRCLIPQLAEDSDICFWRLADMLFCTANVRL